MAFFLKKFKSDAPAEMDHSCFCCDVKVATNHLGCVVRKGKGARQCVETPSGSGSLAGVLPLQLPKAFPQLRYSEKEKLHFCTVCAWLFAPPFCKPSDEQLAQRSLSSGLHGFLAFLCFTNGS